MLVMMFMLVSYWLYYYSIMISIMINYSSVDWSIVLLPTVNQCWFPIVSSDKQWGITTTNSHQQSIEDCHIGPPMDAKISFGIDAGVSEMFGK